MFKGITLKEFNQFFSTEIDCKQYLFDLKWKNGFKCRRCSNNKYWKGRTIFHVRCIECGYTESLTSHTSFHKIQIPLQKAFSIAFHLSVFKKGISSLELAKLFDVNEKTSRRFRKRVQDAMGAWISRECLRKKNQRRTKIDSVLILNRGDHLNGLQRLFLSFEEYQSRTSSATVVKCICTVPFNNEIDQCNLLLGRYVDDEKNLLAWNFKCWLTGIHHHCSEKNIQSYVDEFMFRYNNRHQQRSIFHLLMKAMLIQTP